MASRPASAPPGRQPGLTSKSVQFERRGSASSSGGKRPGSAVGRSSSSTMLVAPSQAIRGPLQLHAGNTQIRQHRTRARPGADIDWSRQWINAPPKVRRRPPVPVPRPLSASVVLRRQEVRAAAPTSRLWLPARLPLGLCAEDRWPCFGACSLGAARTRFAARRECSHARAVVAAFACRFRGSTRRST